MMVSAVPSVIPPTIVQPIYSRLSAPAPLARANGIAPNTMADVVIKIGRKRNLADAITASNLAININRATRLPQSQ
jgi:hypothetical protein